MARHLVYTAGATSIRHEQTPDYSGAKIIYTITERTPAQSLRRACARRQGRRRSARLAAARRQRWLDARSSSSIAHRPTSSGARISLADVDRRRAAASLHEDVKDKFWSMTGDAGAAAQPSPDGKWIAFLSDRDGWDHLYVMPAAGGDADADHQGQVRSVAAVVVARQHAHRLRRERTGSVRATAISASRRSARDPAHATIATITSGRGTNIAPQWSPDGTRLVYQHTDPQNSADLFVIDATSRRHSRCG